MDRIYTAGILGKRTKGRIFPYYYCNCHGDCQEEDKPSYNKDELLVIAGGAAVIAGSFIIGMIPMLFLFVLFWLKVIEKGTPWKHVIIIELLVAAIVLGVFAGWLQVQFPWGIFENFM